MQQLQYLTYIPEEKKNYAHVKTSTQVFAAALICNSQNRIIQNASWQVNDPMHCGTAVPRNTT